MSEQMLLEAQTVARARRTQVGDALKKALDMPFIRTGQAVAGGIGGAQTDLERDAQPTYRGENFSRAALNQVKFKPGQVRNMV